MKEINMEVPKGYLKAVEIAEKLKINKSTIYNIAADYQVSRFKYDKRNCFYHFITIKAISDLKKQGKEHVEIRQILKEKINATAETKLKIAVNALKVIAETTITPTNKCFLKIASEALKRIE